MNWQPIETAPKDVVVMVYTPPQPEDWPDMVRIGFDHIDSGIADDYWFSHGESYEHFCCVAKPEGSIGPKEKAPYTHWMPLPAAPVAEPQGAAVDADGERYRYLRDTPMSEWPSTLPNTIIYQQSARWDAAIDNAIRATALATEFLQGRKS